MFLANCSEQLMQGRQAVGWPRLLRPYELGGRWAVKHTMPQTRRLGVIWGCFRQPASCGACSEVTGCFWPELKHGWAKHGWAVSQAVSCITVRAAVLVGACGTHILCRAWCPIGFSLLLGAAMACTCLPFAFCGVYYEGVRFSAIQTRNPCTQHLNKVIADACVLHLRVSVMCCFQCMCHMFSELPISCCMAINACACPFPFCSGIGVRCPAVQPKNTCSKPLNKVVANACGFPGSFCDVLFSVHVPHVQ